MVLASSRSASWRGEGSHGVAAAVWRHRRAGHGLCRRGILRAELAGAAVDLRGRLQRAQPGHGLTLFFHVCAPF